MMNSQWKLVPVEPTETMVINGFESVPNECFTDEEVWEQYREMSGCQQAGFRAKLCWAAMLGAAPAPPQADTGEVARLTAERDALQLRLNTADQRIDELTQSKDEQVALMPVERSYDVRAKQILAFNTSKQGGGDLDDALGAAYKAALRYTHHPGEHPAPGSVVRPVDPERERLIEIVERYPNGDPLEYDAAVRKLQQ